MGPTHWVRIRWDTFKATATKKYAYFPAVGKPYDRTMNSLANMLNEEDFDAVFLKERQAISRPRMLRLFKYHKADVKNREHCICGKEIGRVNLVKYENKLIPLGRVCFSEWRRMNRVMKALKMKWRKYGKVPFNFGKYPRCTIAEVYVKDPGYLAKILQIMDSDFAGRFLWKAEHFLQSMDHQATAQRILQKLGYDY